MTVVLPQPLAGHAKVDPGRELSACLRQRLCTGQEDQEPREDSLRSWLKAATDALEAAADNGGMKAVEANSLPSSVLEADVPARLLSQLDDLDFEAQKDVARFFVALLSWGENTFSTRPAQVVEYLLDRSTLTHLLLQGCARPEAVLHCGQMLRAMTRSPELVKLLLESGAAAELMILAMDPDFDIASDAFASLRDLLLEHKQVAAAYVNGNFETFFSNFHSLVIAEEKSTDSSPSYLMQRQALRLLGELLLDGNFCHVMQRYASKAQFLMLTMNLLRDDSKLIQLGAFHLFKIFMANPRKPAKIEKILCKNREGLLRLVGNTNSDLIKLSREAEDEALRADLEAVQSMLLKLPEYARSASLSPGSGYSSEGSAISASSSAFG